MSGAPFFLRGDATGNGLNAWGTYTKEYSGNTYTDVSETATDWLQAYNGVTVTLTISRSTDGTSVTVAHTATLAGNYTLSDGTTKTYAGTLTVSSVGASDDIYFALTNEASHQIIKNVLYTAADGTKTNYAPATVKATYINGSSTNTSYGEVTTAYCGYNNISGGKVGLANSGWNVNNVAFLQVDASDIPDGTIITDVTLTADLQQITARALTYGCGYNTSTWSSDMTWDTADRSITTCGSTISTSKASSDLTGQTFNISDAFKNDADNIATVLVYQTAAGGGYVTNISATVTSTSTTTYTVNYFDSEGNSIKSTRTSASVAVGSAVAVTTDDESSFTVDGTKYLFDSSNENNILSIDAVAYNESSNVMNVYFREAETWNWTAKTSVGTDTNPASGTLLEGESATIAYPYGILDGSTFYSRAANGSGDYWRTTFTPNVNNYVETIDYVDSEIKNVVYYTDAENISGVNVATNTQRASNGKMGYTSNNETYKDVTTIAAGKYIIYARGVNANSATRTCNFKIGDNVVYAFSIENGTNVKGNSEEFTVQSEATLSFACDGSSASGCDYFYIVKTGDVKTLGTNGYSTFACESNCTISGADVYTATYDSKNSKVTLNAVTGVIPAGAGVILVGTKGATATATYSSETAADMGDNDLVGVTSSTESFNTGTNYVLSSNGTQTAFVLMASGKTVASMVGKAYLNVAGSSDAKVININIEGVSAISSVKADAEDNAAAYNLAGQRVNRSVKGLVIVGGKKYMNK